MLPLPEVSEDRDTVELVVMEGEPLREDDVHTDEEKVLLPEAQ